MTSYKASTLPFLKGTSRPSYYYFVTTNASNPKSEEYQQVTNRTARRTLEGIVLWPRTPFQRSPYICDSLDAFSLRSLQFTPAHVNAILSMLFLFARYNSLLPMSMLFSRCFFSSLVTIHSCPCQCYSLDAFSPRSVQFCPSHANAILLPLLLSARYNSAHHPPTHIRHSSIIMYVSNMRRYIYIYIYI